MPLLQLNDVRFGKLSILLDSEIDLGFRNQVQGDNFIVIVVSELKEEPNLGQIFYLGLDDKLSKFSNFRIAPKNFKTPAKLRRGLFISQKDFGYQGTVLPALWTPTLVEACGR